MRNPVQHRENIGYGTVLTPDPLTTGLFYSIEIYAPNGKVMNILGFKINAVQPAGSTTGTHSSHIRVGPNVAITLGTITYDQLLSYNYSMWRGAVSDPPDDRRIAIYGFGDTIKGDKETYIYWEYRNNTNGTQAAGVRFDYAYRLVGK